MKWIRLAACGLAALLVSISCQAQVDYSDVKVGSLLDGKGIRIGAFIKPVPLPPGNWLVVARNDSRRNLTGGSGAFNSTSQVTFSLKSTDADNGIFAMVVSFAPDAIPVNWNGNYCETGNFAFSLSYGSTAYTSPKACVTGQWYSAGLRKFLGSAPTHSEAMVREQYTALAPYAAQAPEPYTSIHFNARRDRGRTMDYAMYARIPSDFRPGDGFDLQVREWVKNSAQSMMDMLDNTATPMPAFPASQGGAASSVPVATPKPAAAEQPKPYSDDIKVGSVLENSIALEANATPLPLPPGSWLVVGRSARDVALGTGRQTPVISLTLKNNDPKASIAAMIVMFNPESYFEPNSISSCGGANYSIVETLGTTAQSPTVVCMLGTQNTYSFKGRVVKSGETNGNEWDKKYLSTLSPYLSDLPDAHLSLWLRAARSTNRRVSYMLYTRTPADLKPGDPFEVVTRAWINTTGRSLMEFLNDKPVAITGFPAISPPLAAQADKVPAPAQLWPYISDIQVGSTVGRAIALEPFAKPLPLPPGSWLVVGRSEETAATISGKPSPRINLTLKNNDNQAGIAALVVSFNLDRFTQSISTSSCDSTKYPIVENFGTTASSPVYACVWAGPYTFSFKTRINNSVNSSVEWDKKYLTPLEPYTADMPEAHLWMVINAKRSDSRRLAYTIFGRLPADLRPGDPLETGVRTWAQSAGQSLIDYLDNKASAMAVFPTATTSH